MCLVTVHPNKFLLKYNGVMLPKYIPCYHLNAELDMQKDRNSFPLFFHILKRVLCYQIYATAASNNN